MEAGILDEVSRSFVALETQLEECQVKLVKVEAERAAARQTAEAAQAEAAALRRAVEAGHKQMTQQVSIMINTLEFKVGLVLRSSRHHFSCHKTAPT